MRHLLIAPAATALLFSPVCGGQDGVQLVLGLECPQGGFEAGGAVDCDEFAAAIRDEFTEGTVALVQLSMVASSREADLTVSIETVEGLFILILEDSTIEHEYRREVPSAGSGGFDPDAAAFILRGLLSSFLYEDLEEIPTGSDLVEIAVPPEKHELLKQIVEPSKSEMPEAPEKAVEHVRTIPPMGVEAGYTLLVDISNRLALHGMAAAVGIIAIEWLEVHAGIVLTAPRTFAREAQDASDSYRFAISHVLGNLGVRFRALRLGFFTLEAGLGLRLGAARLEVRDETGNGPWSFEELESSIFAGMGIHLGFLRLLGLRIAVAGEGLLNATGVRQGPADRDILYDPGRFRLAVLAQLTAGF
jgi:hypothetical protein